MMSDDEAARSAQGYGDQVERLKRALAALEDAVERRLEKEADFDGAEEEVQRMNADRGRLAGMLDESESRNEELARVNKEVAARLVSAMETIRTVLDR